MTPLYCSIMEWLLFTGFDGSSEREVAHCLDCYSCFKAGVVNAGVEVEKQAVALIYHVDKNKQRGMQNGICCHSEDTSGLGCDLYHE